VIVKKVRAVAGCDLHVELAGHRVRAGLEAALREAVQNGRLRPGTRLPATRVLAVDLGIGRGTVAEAYAQLVAEGWLTSRQGSGTRVAAARAVVPMATATRAVTSAKVRRLRYDLRAGYPDLSAFPRAAWLAAARKALAAAPSRALGYGDPRGRGELRVELAAYLARVRGVRARPDQIVVCTGSTQGLALVSQVLQQSGVAAVGVEEYSHPVLVRAVSAAGLTPVALSVDQGGAVVGSAADVGAMLLTPAHQFPLGPALSPERRTEAAGWAARTGGLIIEDDYDGEFRYDRRPVGALQALAPEHVIYMGTASKALAPGLRLGWLVLPEPIVEAVADAKARADLHTGSFEQLTLAEFIRSGAYDRHIRRSRLIYRRRRDQLVTVFARHAPGVDITGIAAGFHAVAILPPGQVEHEAISAAAARDVAIEGLGAYATGTHNRGPALVINYAGVSEHAYTIALTRLCRAITAWPAGIAIRAQTSPNHELAAGM
jgi:GntR family transcriptional regulator / MocR family aminotransferase